jgi:hypothetical protein
VPHTPHISSAAAITIKNAQMDGMLPLYENAKHLLEFVRGARQAKS